MKNICLLLAIVGAVIPYGFFVQHFSSVGLGLPDFVAALLANPAAGGFTADLLITSAVFWLYVFQKKNLAGGPSPLPFIAGTSPSGSPAPYPQTSTSWREGMKTEVSRRGRLS